MDGIQKSQANLHDSDVTVRALAAEQLGQAGPDAAIAALDLVSACADEESVRTWVVEALENMGPPSIEARVPLTKLLDEQEPLVTYWAATLLGRLGAAAESSQNEIAHVLSESKDLSTRERAAWALGEIGPTSDQAIAALQAAAEGPDPRLARLASGAIPPHQQ